MRTDDFRVSRLALAYLAVAQYVRTYWWFVAIIPAFGLVCLFLPGVFKVVGIMAILWPMSLPARAIVATSKSGKLMEKGAYATLEDGVLYLHGLDGDGVKLSLARVRRIERRRGFLVLVMARGDFLALPLQAVSEPFSTAVGSGLSRP